ncbi:MAG: phytoene/squalene synthase family protein [Desulfobulbaceae bacterium]|nr:phytoene/squalene synthase family protein [Candidatus Kapabacteria bacterium]MBS3999978.1 phytoene/squalene synthase family protein [Desulfobulbaceae bacterium]
MINYWLKDDNKPAFMHAKAIIEFHAKSFAIASKLLPEHKRWGTWGVYSFCRYTDNIIDKPRSRNQQDIVLEIERLRTELDLAFKHGESEHPVIKAFIASQREFNIPINYAYELIEGVMMDSEFTGYQNFDELYRFCYRVASVVGLMMTYVIGFKNEDTLKYAEKMGIAMQLTNILRDVEEDSRNSRIYIPNDELKKFNVTNSQIIESRFDDNFRNLMKFQVERAQSYYKEAEKGIGDLSKDSQFAIYSASKIYGGILQKIKENDYNPFLGRVFLPKSQKLMILLSEWVKRLFR